MQSQTLMTDNQTTTALEQLISLLASKKPIGQGLSLQSSPAVKVYSEKDIDVLQSNPDLVQTIVSELSAIKLSTRKIEAKDTEKAAQIRALLQGDKVLLSSLDKINKHLKSVQDQKDFAADIQGMKQALGAVYEFGVICRSESLQKTAALINHGLDLAVGLSQLSRSTLPAGLLSMGSALGQVGMVFSAVVGIYSLFKKKKKEDNQFPQIVLSYLQAISSQIYNMHSDMLRGFDMVTQNQQKMIEFMVKSVEHLDILVRAEAHQTRAALADVEHHLDTRLDSVMRLTTAGVQETHLQPFYTLMSKLDYYMKEKDSISPDKIKKLNHDLSVWLKGDSHYSANPFHTGGIQLSSLRGDLLHFVNTELADIEHHPEALIKNIGFLAQMADKAFKVPMVQADKKIDTDAVPSPVIWLQAAGKYLDFRKEFADVLSDDKETMQSTMTVAENMFSFIKLLQTDPAIYQKLFDGYEEALDNIIAILNMATLETNKKINAKLLKVDDQGSLSDEKIAFDVSKNFMHSLRDLSILNEEKTTGDHITLLFNWYCQPLGNFTKGMNTVHTPIPKNNISLIEFRRDLPLEQLDILLAITFLQRVGLISNKSSFSININKKGGPKLGTLMGDITFSKNLDAKSVPVSVYKIKYDLDGSEKAGYMHIRSNYDYSIHDNYASDFDFDIATGNHIYEEGCYAYLRITNMDDLVQRYLRKRKYSAIELSSDYQRSKEYIQTTLTNYILTQRKEIIRNVVDATKGHAKEPYQSKLKSAYEKLDTYKNLLTCYASLAGMSQVIEQSDGLQSFSGLPDVLTKLPSSSSIEIMLSEYLKDTTTVATPWPVTSLKDGLSAAKETVLRAVEQESHRSIAPQSELPVAQSIQFISPLQVELSLYFYQLITLISELHDRPVVKPLSMQEEEFIVKKYDQCLRHYKLQKKWIKKVKPDWDCSEDIQENVRKIEKLLKSTNDDIYEKCFNLLTLSTCMLDIHNLLSTYYAETSGYPLKVEFTTGISAKLQEMQKKLDKIKQILPTTQVIDRDSKSTPAPCPGTRVEICESASSSDSMRFFSPKPIASLVHQQSEMLSQTNLTQ